MPSHQNDSKFVDAPSSQSSDEEPNWPAIKELLDQVKQESQEEYVALFSVRDTVRNIFDYYIQPLHFSDSARASAKGQPPQHYLYKLKAKDGVTPMVIAAHLPGSPIIRKELAYHLRGKASDETDTQAKTKASVKRKTTKHKTNSRRPVGTPRVQCEWRTTVPGGWICMEWKGQSHCSYQPPVTSFVCGGGGGGSGGGGFGGPHWPPRDECWPEDCFGGSGSDGINDKQESAMEIIKDPSFKNTKAECVFDKLNQNSTSFFDVIEQFAGKNTHFDLVFKVEDISDMDGTITLGETSKTGNEQFTITLNSRYLNSVPTLDLARTLLHEGIHAEMKRKIASVGANITKKNFPGIYDYYTRFGAEGDWTHQQMAAHYLSTLIDGLKEFDANQHSKQFYESISWIGLKGTVSWNELSSNKRSQLNSEYQIFLSTGDKNCNN